MNSAMVAWEGRSPFTGDKCALILTPNSANEKTGPMWQAWLLLQELSPFDALASKRDAAICGGCARRGHDDESRSCYVSLFTGPLGVWRKYRAGRYPVVSLSEAARTLAGDLVRLCAYGDPVVLPLTFWRGLLQHAAGWVGYTHLWQFCDPGFRKLLMASVDSEHEQTLASLKGWRTFRVREIDAPIRATEFVCPASNEGGHRTTCSRCRLCRGQSSPAKSVVIIEHAKKSQPTGSTGKYGDLYRALDSGSPADVILDKRERQRVYLAIRQRYIRQGLDPSRVSSEKLDDGRIRFQLAEAK